MRMGEVVLSSEEEMEIELEKKDGSSEVFGWDRFLPRMVLRVLLVEADDSTRQIISALLRKCSYRVSAVPDGLMAWETLKGRAHNIDLVLTEVELPSISGFALLTLAMEHEICKKIPVIMMSSHDSISIVFKCMLKGAADFLIKPVRRNELRNLWQHVWRRHSLLDGHIPQNLPIIQPKAEATSGKNATSNHSSDSKQKSKDKGSDAQSSCTSRYLEAESAYMQNMQGLSNLKCRSSSNLSYKDKEKNEECIKLGKKSFGPDSKTGGASDELIVSERFRSGSEAAPCSEAYTSTVLIVEEDSTSDKTMPQVEGMEPNNDRGNSNITSGINKCNDELIEPSQGAIDLIGTFDNHRKSTNGQSTFSDGINKFEFAPQLELSLRKFVSSSSKDQGTDERHTLNHSTASAFSWYNNSKTFPTPGESFRKLKDDACKCQEVLSTQLYDNATRNSQPCSAATLSNSQDYMTSLVIGQSGQSEVTFPRAQLGLIPVPGVRFDNICAGYTHVFPPLFYTQSGLSGVWSPKSPCQREQSPFPSCTSVHSNPDTYDLEGYRRSDENTNNSIDQNACEQNNTEPLQELIHSSPAAGQSACSSLCNGFGNNHNAGTSGAGGVSRRIDGNTALSDPVEKVTGPDGRNGGTLFIHDGFRGIDSQRSSRRQAALTKFRLKRKDRCFEKKVRYQSRKNLAEQRPRVKGQFVRQVRNDTTSTASNADTGP